MTTTAQLPDIDDVPQRPDQDADCLAEIRRVLEKHGKLGRFGLFLMHSHFRLDPEEVLVEHCDINSRTLTIKPAHREALQPSAYKETMWRLDTNETTQRCVQVCLSNSDNEHLYGAHTE